MNTFKMTGTLNLPKETEKFKPHTQRTSDSGWNMDRLCFNAVCGDNRHMLSVDALYRKDETNNIYVFTKGGVDDNGNKVEYDETYWIGDQEIILEPLTAERAQELKDYVLSVDKLYYYDAAIVDIICEEAAPFFAGQKTAEQAAEIIQSRVQIYVNENM